MAGYKIEVMVIGSGQWHSNWLRYETLELAVANATSLFMRWTAVREWRVVDNDGRVVATIGGWKE